MKRFIISILCVSVFFIGLGALVDKAGANFRSDEKALALVRQARLAIGGESAIAGIQSLRIVGQTTRNFKIDGLDKAESGETEIAMQLPDKLMKMTKIGHGDGTVGDKIVDKDVNVVVVGNGKEAHKIIVNDDDTPPNSEGVQKIIIKKSDGTTDELNGSESGKVIFHKGDKTVFTGENGKTMTSDGAHVMINRVGGEGHHDAMRHNELLRLTLGLLLTAPQGMDVSYTFGGESSVEGTACNIVVAEFGGSAFKIYLGQASNLPVMMTYKGMPMPTVMKFRTKDPNAAGEPKDNMVFTRKVEGPAPDAVEYSVKFSDYRSTGGVQLPYKWTQTVGGATDETFDVTSYEVNPANIAEKFQNQKVMVRTAKPDGQK
ncbi:MAG: hypothetical protein ABIO36_05435 [Pyrinomonadaceae bacterium]